jgi:hypothetical protein
MPDTSRLGIVSDIHYAGPAEQARGNDFEIRGIPNPLLRLLVRMHRRYLWLRNPLSQNYLLDNFLAQIAPCDLVIANGDYSCNSAFIGVSDAAAIESARLCLDKLRDKFGTRLRATIGDHELGKMSFVGMRGGMRLASWRSATDVLGLRPFWREEIGNYVLLGMTSSLIALPAYEPDTLPDERPQWHTLREQHLQELRNAFAEIKPDQRLLLFCHDPTALPFLAREPSVRSRLGQIDQTIIGHLHSNLIVMQSRVLAGMPRITFLGHTARRLSKALRQAREWKPFKVRLCPALAGVELLKDGGFLEVELDNQARTPPKFFFRPLPRRFGWTNLY